MSSKPSPRQKSPSPIESEEAQVLSLDELRTAIASIAALANAALAHIGPATSRIAPVMLTSREFAERHKEVTAKTIERRCRDGEFPLARNPKGAGWRIPEFYLWRDDPPPELRACFARSGGGESTDGRDGAAPVAPPADAREVAAGPDVGAAADAGATDDAGKKDDIDDYLEFLTHPNDGAAASKRGTKPRGGQRRSGSGPPQERVTRRPHETTHPPAREFAPSRIHTRRLT